MNRGEPVAPDDTEVAVAVDFDGFYQAEFADAARLAWLLTRSSSIAEDLAQDAFIAVRARFDEIDHARAFVHRAIINRARSWQRDERRHERKLAAVPHPGEAAIPGEHYLFDAVGKLPYRQRVVIVARYWGGWSEADLAEALGCRPGTVKSLASRALERLRTEVER